MVGVTQMWCGFVRMDVWCGLSDTPFLGWLWVFRVGMGLGAVRRDCCGDCEADAYTMVGAAGIKAHSIKAYSIRAAQIVRCVVVID